MITGLLLATIVVMDPSAGWTSKFTDCQLDFLNITAIPDANHLYAQCDDGGVVFDAPPQSAKPSAPRFDEVIVSDGADSIERHDCALVRDFTFNGQREITVSCETSLFTNGIEGLKR